MSAVDRQMVADPDLAEMHASLDRLNASEPVNPDAARRARMTRTRVHGQISRLEGRKVAYECAGCGTRMSVYSGEGECDVCGGVELEVVDAS